MAAFGVTDVRRLGDDADHEVVQLLDGRLEGAEDVHEQHDPDPVAVVPRLVLVGVVEEQALAFFPVGELVAHSDAARLDRLGDHQRQVIAQDAPVRTPVVGDVLLRREDREEGRGHARHLFEELGGLRAAGAVGV